jgi:hypothetical protein
MDYAWSVLLVNAARTGVERGAYQGAVAAGIPVAGFMRQAARDELGGVPPELARHLTPCPGRSKRIPVQRAIESASAVLIVLPDPDDVSTFPVMQYVLKHVRRNGRALRFHSPDAPIDPTLAWLTEAEQVYVTGPRETRWPPGVSIARRLLRALGPAEAIA